MGLDSEAVVQEQVDAYNRRDIDSFVSFYSDHIEIFDFPGAPVLDGVEELRERYAARFRENPDLHAEIHRRIVNKDFVYDLETASGRQFGRRTVVAIYQVEDAVIRRVWFQRASA